MRSCKNVMATSMSEFVELVDRARSGVPAGRGWGVYKDVHCPYCGTIWIQVAKVGTKAKTCPFCGVSDPQHPWLDKWAGIGGDGGFLNPVGWIQSVTILN